jgi:hypothetical protein
MPSYIQYYIEIDHLNSCLLGCALGREGDEHYIAFITEYGLYGWNVACFGLRNAPAEFARFMSLTLREFLINDFVVAYFDDIIIYSKDLDTHWKHVQRVLQRLHEKGIDLKSDRN